MHKFQSLYETDDSNSFFDLDTLSKSILSEAETTEFKKSSQPYVLYDPHYKQSMRVHFREDGHILIESTLKTIL